MKISTATQNLKALFKASNTGFFPFNSSFFPWFPFLQKSLPWLFFAPGNGIEPTKCMYGTTIHAEIVYIGLSFQNLFRIRISTINIPI